MKALVIGGSGFVGGYLIDHLLDDFKWDVCITKQNKENVERSEIKAYDLNILDKKAISKILNQEKPDYIFHLAAQSSVYKSWLNPNLTIDVNIKGCINLLEAIRNLKISPKILLIGSSEEYGKIKSETISEKESINPENIYALTKACQNMIGKIYAKAYGLDIIMVRAFNHCGPKQKEGFVVSDFCSQVVQIERGNQKPVIKVGNLNAKRDFTDVRDVVKAYVELILKGKSNETYNVGQGHAIKIEDILKMILSQAKCNIKVQIDQSKIRPLDIPVIKADISKIKSVTDWQPQIDIQTTIKDTLDYWRNLK